jgi:hypothetical protein
MFTPADYRENLISTLRERKAFRFRCAGVVNCRPAEAPLTANAFEKKYLRRRVIWRCAGCSPDLNIAVIAVNQMSDAIQFGDSLLGIILCGSGFGPTVGQI